MVVGTLFWIPSTHAHAPERVMELASERRRGAGIRRKIERGCPVRKERYWCSFSKWSSRAMRQHKERCCMQLGMYY
jgi:hypothetical protein